MTNPIKILALAGSTRTESLNKKLIRQAVAICKDEEVDVTLIDLRDLPMPLYDGDLEKREGIPENGMKFMQLLMEHDGFMIASPEYNTSVPAVLKNAIDWASRPVKGLKPLVAFDHKVVLLLSASDGALGGLRNLYAMRTMLSNIRCIVIPDQLAVPKAHEAFTETGEFRDEAQKKKLAKCVNRFIKITTALKAI
jgi:chromate reductase, NAD(P)H dehydrogenase (quinone)